jgi:hypothetical protein
MPDHAEDRLARTQAALANIKRGITVFVSHPLKDSPTVRVITPTWDARVADFEIFTSSEMRTFIEDQGLRIIGYKDLVTAIERGAAK